MLVFQDQMSRKVALKRTPKRVVSLVPSITEYLIDLGVQVVGRTKFCIHPHEKIGEIPRIGGTKKFHFDVIKSLQPDLIIGNKEENYQEGIEELISQYPVWMGDITTIASARWMMLEVGALLEKEEKAQELIAGFDQRLEKIKNTASGTALYLIWHQPMMAAGKNTYIDHMLSWMGYQNILEQQRYPTVSAENISKLSPNAVLLSSEPFPFKEKHLEHYQAMFPEAGVTLVNGELYSWYGSRLLHLVR
jgi:ABC-type Fe3+-hydroxamate transport system substrate-binding protein